MSFPCSFYFRHYDTWLLVLLNTALLKCFEAKWLSICNLLVFQCVALLDLCLLDWVRRIQLLGFPCKVSKHICCVMLQPGALGDTGASASVRPASAACGDEMERMLKKIL